MISGLIVPLYYTEIETRGAARDKLDQFKDECAFAWHLSSPDEGPETFIFFNRISKAKR